MTFGERVRFIRKMNNLTQGEFGKAINFSTSSICHIENDRIERKKRTAELIAKKYHVNKEWLLYGIGDIEPKGEIEKTLSDKMQMIPSLYETAKIASMHMTKHDWKKANEFIKKLGV